ncbi:hypothetical protein [uncultured Shewanella sp.]|uniref:hypothetical protein n=1 Tax=uncultured Shewanella sp. TaxID=173975 RepID=UPI00261BB95F|nr:hypothetical protein [uncultured Shewanella sp.]
MGNKVRKNQKCFPSTLFFSVILILSTFLPTANAATHKVPLTIIEGDYLCQNLLRGYSPQLSINLTPTVTPYEDRFYIFQLLFSGTPKSMGNLTKGYMLYDVQTHTAISHLDNRKNPGLTYFTFSNEEEISFITYFLEPGLNKVGEYQCTKAN